MAKRSPRKRSESATRRIERKLDLIIAHLTIRSGKDSQMIKTLAEFQAEMKARLDKNAADVAANTSLVGSVKALLDGQTASIAALKAQLEEALKGGADPTQLQALLDAFDAQIAVNEAAAADLANAVVANTPAQ